LSLRIGVVVGSLRKDAMSRRIAQALAALAPEGVELQEIAYGDLPLYNADLEAPPPASWQRLRAEIADCDGLLFITPEYNRSVPAGVKNAVDVASKPAGRNLWVGKPAFVIGQSSGPLGGLAGAFALKQTLVGAGAAVLSHPEIYLGRVLTLFEGERLLPDTAELLRGALAAFQAWTQPLTTRRQA